MTRNIEQFFLEGCGRCSLGGTPDCKVHRWTTELALLRSILQETELEETVKWGSPCYTFQGSNVLLLSAFKQNCRLSFLKGVLLEDPDGLLEKPGENSRSTRMLCFTKVQEIQNQAAAIRSFIQAAIEIEKAGRQVEIKETPEAIPEELAQRFAEDPSFQSAFEALTPGRQRGYLLYFTAAKQSKTRVSRIEKCTAQIFRGIGLHDKYQSKK